MTSVNLLLHPVRLRIVQTFLGGRELTTAQVATELADVPASGLYRHLALLTDAGVLSVVSERRVRGAVERRYALRLENAWLRGDDVAELSREEHAQAFATFVAGLLASYERYLAEGQPDLVRDGVSYSMNALWLDDEEYLQFLREIAAVVAPRGKLGPAAGRRRRLVASAFMPLAGKHDNEQTDHEETDHA
jgi:DNA-binding transcriptional ArsR family regulator